MEDGKVVKLVGAFHDITDRKRAEEAQESMRSQLLQAQKLESVGLLAGGVAHDFNNMLAVILGNTNLALEQLAPDDPMRAHFVEVRDAASRSADLTRQLLAFARKQEVRPRILDLNKKISEALNMVGRLVGENINLRWEPGEALWPVLADPSQMDQILANLCVNARAAIADVGTVTVSTANSTLNAADCATHADAVPGDYVRLSVTDTGHGMSPITLSHIFEPFFTTKGLGQGTGLGLSMVYGAVRQAGGFIRAASVLGEGSTFEILLPRHTSTEPVTSPRRTATTDPDERRGTETILLVEDEPSVLRLAKRLLERQGYTVYAASGPTEAIRFADALAENIQLLLTDVIMPVMNGRDLAKTILATHAHLKVLFMSGHTADIMAEQGMLPRGSRLLEKPFSAAELATAVRAVLDRA
jgi:nitrogen-specific signal transduction histidine kinase/ActR/RegA family two-component response regulator